MKDFKVQLAAKFDERKLSFPCLISPKLDGIRAQYYKGEFYTRNQKVVRGMSHLKEALKPLESRFHLDGELMIPGLPFQKSSGKIRSFNETPKAFYYVFDAPYVERPQESRLKALEAIPLLTAQIVRVDHFIVHDMSEIMRWYNVFRKQGYEGAMVKSMYGMYKNKRSNDWMKLKEIETYDVVCTGFFRGQGRLSDTLGGIIIELDGVSVRVGGGFSDQDRDHIWANKDYFRGMVCVVACQELTPDGSMRHPRLINWRDDIDPEQLGE